jgi:hypothetical protein
MNRIHIPSEWHDDDLISFADYIELTGFAERTVRDQRVTNVGLEWEKIGGKLYARVREIRRFLGYGRDRD